MSDSHDHHQSDVNEEKEEEAGLRSRPQPRDDDDDDRSATWLQLSIGGDAAATSFNGSENAYQSHHWTTTQRSPPSGGCRLIEHDLLSSVVWSAPQPQVFQVSVADQFPSPPQHHLLQHNFIGVDSTRSSLTGLGTYFWRPFPLHTGGPSSDVRVIAYPRRPQVGVWFMLQASPIQAKEPLLPQIPKSYLRIKDGRTTIGLLVKYLVNKLRLDSELEVEIRCRGQELEPFLTLQHVRDNIWYPPNSSRDLTLLSLSSSSSSSTTSSLDHVMVLHYARSL